MDGRERIPISSRKRRALAAPLGGTTPNADAARLDYTVKFAADGTQVKGTVTLTTFPLVGNPLDGGGTVAGHFTFVGNLVKP